MKCHINNRFLKYLRFEKVHVLTSQNYHFGELYNCEKFLFAAKILAAVKVKNAKSGGGLLALERGTRLALTVL